MQHISRRTAIAGAVATVGAAGAFFGQWLARSTTSARAAVEPSARMPLFNDPQDPVLGNPHGTLPVVEFFDYRCPYCRRMYPLIDRLLRENPDIRYVAKQWPIFGGPSVSAARMAFAASWQGKFAAVNRALFSTAGTLDEKRIDAVVRSAGVDMVPLQHDLASRDAELQSMLGRVAMQAASFGLQGTPGFIIGTYLVPGALSYDDLRKLVAEARTKLQPAGETAVR